MPLKNRYFAGLVPVILYFCFAVFVFKAILFSPGFISGGDWGLPLTSQQIHKQAEIFGSTWFSNVFLQFRNINTSGYFFYSFLNFLAPLGCTGDIFAKMFLLFIFVLSGFSAYSLLRFLGIAYIPSIFGGFVFITTPLYFNYALMGWTFVLLAVGLFPLIIKYFLKAMMCDDWSAVVLVALLYWIASLQSQSVVWVPLLLIALFPAVVSNLAEFRSYIIKTLSVMALFSLLSQFYTLHIIAMPDTAVSGSKLIRGSDALGAMGNFYPLNILRGFGSLFNNQFETIVGQSGMGFLNFILPLMGFSAVFSRFSKKLILSFLLISLIPVAFWLLSHYRSLLAYIPFANVIRDFPRFSVFSSVGYSLLAAIFLNGILRKGGVFSRWFAFICVSLWFLSLSPWWSGGATDFTKSIVADIRLRLIRFPAEFFEVESILAKEQGDFKGIYLPFGLLAQAVDNVKFNGPYNTYNDIFAFNSPIPGAIIPTGRKLGDNHYETLVTSALRNGKLVWLSHTHNLKYIILRKNMTSQDLNLRQFVKQCDKYFTRFYSGKKISVYVVKDALPHFYTPVSIIRTDNAAKLSIASDSNPYSQSRTSLFPENAPDHLLSRSAPGSAIEFRKIAPTKYRLRIHRAPAVYPLVFAESFNPGWKVYPGNGIKSWEVPGPQAVLRQYRVLDGNASSQADSTELSAYLSKGFVTALGDLNEKHLPHRKWENDREKLDYIEHYFIGFVSKYLNGTIQNNNLPSGPVRETWGIKALPEENHYKVNFYANAWIIKAGELCAGDPDACKINSDGTYDYELVVEFLPQKYFIVGLVVSLATLICCAVFLAGAYFNGKRKPGSSCPFPETNNER